MHFIQILNVFTNAKTYNVNLKHKVTTKNVV